MRIISAQNDFSSRTTAFEYQHQAFEAVKDLDYCAIFHEQGLGKTKIASDLMLYWLGHREIDTVLVVTKKQLVQNWLEELAVHTNIRPVAMGSDKGRNYLVLNSPSRIVVTNFETLSTDKNRIQLFLKTRNVAIVIDESTKLKNPDARLTKDFFDLAPSFKIRTIMTGTPVANRPYDIWAQVFFLDHGKSLGTDFENFKESTDLKNSLSEDANAQEDFAFAVGGIFDKIRSFSVRETKSSAGIVLPAKRYETLRADFPPIQARIYDSILKQMSLEMKKQGRAFTDTEEEALKRLLRLNQAASNPRLLVEDYNETSAKEKLLDELISAISVREEKCIVWSIYIETVDYLARKYARFNPARITGKLSMDARNDSVKRFKSDDACRMLFATPQSAKEGLTLTVANNVIFYDRGFNLDDYLQAQDRIHRISQTRDCNIYTLIANGSIDEWIDSLLEAKQHAASLAQGDIDQATYERVADYSFGEIIREILSEGDPTSCPQ